jgi:predicted dehydrogenase
LKTFIVGLGHIGMGYDYKEDYHVSCLTHLNAILAHDGYELVGGFDVSLERRNMFESKSKVSSFDDLLEGLTKTNPDFVILSTPTETHFEILKTILKQKSLKAILCEKPVSYDDEEATQMVDLCQKNNVKLFVNYQRFYLPSSDVIKKRLFPSNIKIEFLKGVCWYSKGLIHNGSHFINLLESWLGNLKLIESIESHKYWSNEDTEPDALFSFQNGKVFFISSRESDFSHYSIELVTSEGKLTCKNGGDEIYWQDKVPDPTFPGYTILSKNMELIESNTLKSQYFVLDKILKYMENHNSVAVCEAFSTLNMIRMLRKLKVEK